MCGRVIQSSGPLHLAIVEGLDFSAGRMGNIRPRYNAAPSQELLVIRENHKTGERSLDLITWGLIPHYCDDPKGGRKPINAKAETIATLPTFRDAFAKRRCIVPVDGFFEWRAVKGARAKQPYAIGMKDGSPFVNASAKLWEDRDNPAVDDNLAVMLDYDNDGDADVLVASLAGPDRVLINDGTGHLHLHTDWVNSFTGIQRTGRSVRQRLTSTVTANSTWCRVRARWPDPLMSGSSSERTSSATWHLQSSL
jgi:putative SOS response-associated peptidase YedK